MDEHIHHILGKFKNLDRRISIIPFAGQTVRADISVNSSEGLNI